MRHYLTSVFVGLCLTLFLLPLAAVPYRNRPEILTAPSNNAPIDLQGEWSEAGLTYDFKPSLDGKFVRMNQNVYPATATWDGCFLSVTWENYTGCYELKEGCLVGWYADRFGCVTRDRFVRK